MRPRPDLAPPRYPFQGHRVLRSQQRAVAELEAALKHWNGLADLGRRFNQLPVPSNSKALFSWASLTPAVEKDIELAKAPLTSSNSTR